MKWYQSCYIWYHVDDNFESLQLSYYTLYLTKSDCHLAMTEFSDKCEVFNSSQNCKLMMSTLLLLLLLLLKVFVNAPYVDVWGSNRGSGGSHVISLKRLVESSAYVMLF